MKAYDYDTLPAAGELALPDRIARAAIARGAALAGGSDVYNIIYLEGGDVNKQVDGWKLALNDNRANQFNDTRLLLQIIADKALIVNAWEATTEPGRFWTENPMDERGAFHIALGHQTCWRVGKHHDQTALVQAKPVAGYRDGRQSYKREGKVYVEDGLGINQHGGYDLPRLDLGRSSAGCLVGRTMAGHARFMQYLKSDRRYKTDVGPGFLFSTTVLPASEV